MSQKFVSILEPARGEGERESEKKFAPKPTRSSRFPADSVPARRRRLLAAVLARRSLSSFIALPLNEITLRSIGGGPQPTSPADRIASSATVCGQSPFDDEDDPRRRLESN